MVKTLTKATVPYCPQCGKFCGAGCPMDAKGQCTGCGRTPVELEAKSVTWRWCAEHEQWHRNACAKHASKRCCVERTVMMVAAGGAPLVAGRFCPECAVFCGPTCPEEAGKCKRCGRAPVAAKGVERSWYWCTTHAMWHDAPCPAEATDDCCAERRVILIAHR
jgi:hypothetical protein